VDVRLCPRGKDNGSVRLNFSRDIVIRDCTFRRIYNDCIYCWKPTNITIADSRFTEIADDPNATDPKYGSDGVQLSGANTVRVIGNYINMQGTDSPKGCLQFGNHPKQYPAADIRIENNVCLHGNYGVGVQGHGFVIRNNVFRHQGRESGQPWAAGIISGDDDDNTGLVIADNVITDAVNGIYFFRKRHIREIDIRGNVIRDCRKGILMDTDVMVAGRLHRNVIAPISEMVFDIQGSASVAPGGTWTSDYNVIGPEQPRFVSWFGKDYAALEAFRSAEGQAEHSATSRHAVE